MSRFMEQEEYRALTALSGRIIGCAVEVHQLLGPGLLESVYQAALAHELRVKGLGVLREHPVPVTYKEIEVAPGFRLDLLVEERIVIEVKAVQELLPIHLAQTLTYLRLTGKRLGLILNFNSLRLVDGIKRLIL